MPFNNYSPTYVFKGVVQSDTAPSNNNDLVRKQDVSGLSYISSVDSSYFSVNGSGQLSASNLLITDVKVDTTQSSLANYVSNTASSANLGVGDVVILTNPTPNQMYIVKTNDGTNASDYEQIRSSLTQAEVLAHLSAGAGISINGSGQISSTITQYTDTNARSALSAGTGMTYNSGTGAFSCSITQYTDTLARLAISTPSGSGLAYNNGTGAMSVDNGFFRKTFTNQSFTANSAKSFQHDLGEKLVQVSVYDSGDNLIHAQVSLTDADNLEITSSDALTGVSVVISI